MASRKSKITNARVWLCADFGKDITVIMTPYDETESVLLVVHRVQKRFSDWSEFSAAEPSLAKAVNKFIGEAQNGHSS